jgi:pseudouridine-5'-phosphate glycosidase
MALRTSCLLASEVAHALAAGRPIVALESTLVAHGLPWPANLETARAAEAAVCRAGAIPATIAVLQGTIHVGLTASEIERLAASNSFAKASRRDLSTVVAQVRDAATTVSATLWIARTCGVRLMATGGIGGVHRDAATSFDISADLDELARADGALVVCSGVKSILDIAATLEAMETRGIAVIGYRTDVLPAFTAVSSGLPLEARAETPADVAAVVRVHRALGLPGAIVLAQPVPAAAAIDAGEMESALERATSEAKRRGIAGKAITPFLLDRVREVTEGRSLRANTALILANAALAGEVAVALAADAPGA